MAFAEFVGSFANNLGMDALVNMSSNAFISALIILGMFIAVGFVLSYAAKRIAVAITKRTKTKLDDKIVKRIKRPVFKIVVLIGLLLVLLPFEIKNGFWIAYRNIIYSLMLFFFARFIIAALNIIVIRWAYKFAKKTKSSLDKDVLPLMTKSVKVIIYVIVFVMILGQWGVSIAPLLTGLGIAGIAIGFAVKDSLANIFGGVSLILDGAYKVGDIVELGDGTTGKIYDIGLRSTKLVNWDNNLVAIPNGSLANMRITNIMWPDTTVKMKITVGVAYDSNAKKVKEVITEVLRKNKKVLFDERHPVVRLDSFGDSSLNFVIMYWTRIEDKWTAFEEVNNKILTEFRKNKIEIPFPQRDVNLKPAFIGAVGAAAGGAAKKKVLHKKQAKSAVKKAVKKKRGRQGSRK